MANIVPVQARIPEPLARYARARASLDGVTISDLIARLLLAEQSTRPIADGARRKVR
jgi:hypothetical protein